MQYSCIVGGINTTSDSFKSKYNLHFSPFYFLLWAIEIACSVELSSRPKVILFPLIYCPFGKVIRLFTKKVVSEYDQEIPQSQTADNPVAPRGRAAQPSRDTRKTN